MSEQINLNTSNERLTFLLENYPKELDEKALKHLVSVADELIREVQYMRSLALEQNGYSRFATYSKTGQMSNPSFEERGGIMHPIQPVYTDDFGTIRFQKNAIVRHLLDTHPSCNLNQIATMDFSKEDRQQLAQLIGYSLSGYSTLSYVDDTAYLAACALVSKEDPLVKKIEVLEQQLSALKTALREPVAALFGIHPDDLEE